MLAGLGALALLCVSAVAGLWVLRRPRVNPDQVDVDELALEVARIAKQVRRDRMRSVRAGEGSPEDASLAGPPELREAQALVPPSGALSKEELRRHVFGRRP
jgi:hypothetical protein